jgi:5'-phosphate synthase pdxT subunit
LEFEINMRVGVLAIQGDFAAHARMLLRAGAGAVEVRRSVELDGVDGLILPGGESTTMLKLLVEEGLDEAVKDFARSGRPVFGTCAGAILLANEVTNPEQGSLGLIDMTVERNSYGRQVDSFIASVDTNLTGGRLEAVFIRAPRITRAGAGVEVLASLAGEPVLVARDNIVAATFHPELTGDERAHRYFLKLIESRIDTERGLVVY